MNKLVCLLMVLLATVSYGAEISPLLVPVDRSEEPGTDVQFWLVYLNSGTTPATIHVPQEVPITLGPLPYKVHQSLVRADDVSDVTIAPGGFKRILFRTLMPANATGPVTFEMDQSEDAAPVVIVAATPPAIEEQKETVATMAGPATTEPSPPSVPPAGTVASSTSATKATPPETLTLKQTHGGSWGGDPLTEAFANRFTTYQPTYFIAGSRPTAKFQISLKYKIFDDDGALAEKFSPLNHLYLAYTQTSFWDWVSPSTPFTDNSYRPELMFSYNNILRKDSTFLDLTQLGLQGGFQHESNGRDGLASRSLNLIYIRPIFVWDIDKAHDLFISVAPRVYTYVFDLSDNPDIAQYRGYGDVRLVIGQRYGFQAAMFARVGEDFNRGSFELDLSQPLRERSRGNLDLYLYGQFFTGYGEQLIQYNKSTTTFRIGLAFVR
jgi:phospholipase A1/A2